VKTGQRQPPLVRAKWPKSHLRGGAARGKKAISTSKEEPVLALDARSPAELLARLEAELKAQRPLLTFSDRALERDYRWHHLNAHYVWARITTLVGLVVFALFALMDWQIQEAAVSEVLLTMRFAMVVPLIAIAFLISLHPVVLRWGLHFWLGAVLLLALMTAALVSYPALVGSTPPFEQIMLFQIGASLVLGLLFSQAVLVNLAVLIPYGLSVALAPEALRYPYWSVVELAVAGMLCCMGAWFLERRGRREFLVQRMLKLSANIDGLTRLANRRKLMEHLELIWRQAAREGRSLCAMMIDIDHFKEYNDHYGHLAGDECLQQVANVLAGCARRPFDLVCRYGGEEFVLIFYDADEAATAEVAERVRGQLATLAVPHLASPTAAHVTASIGAVCCRPSPHASSDVLMRAADAALYQAKRQGRDRLFTGSLEGREARSAASTG
jgi:diguanylate cyclase (GGDEF)-like protein